MLSDEGFEAWCDARAAERAAVRDAETQRAKRRAGDELGSGRRWQGLPKTDRQLAALAGGTSKPRLELGLLLHHMMERRWFIQLGLPSFRAYATQRVSQGARWANDARGLARTLFEMPGFAVVAGALERGVISWSMAGLVGKYLERFARHGVFEGAGVEAAAAPTVSLEHLCELEERAMLELVRSKTVREAKHLLAERLEALQAAARSREEATDEVPDETPGAPLAVEIDDEADEPLRRLERTIPMHEAWVVEQSRLLLNALVHHRASDELFIDALVGEATASIGLRTEEEGEVFRRLLAEAKIRRRTLEDQREGRTRDTAVREAAAERRFRRWLTDSGSAANEPLCTEPIEPLEPIEWRALPGSARELDAEIRRLCAEIELAELDLCTRLVEFERRNGWRQLGFASRDQYARERLGLGRRAAHELRARGRALRNFPDLYDAVKDQKIGMCAARRLAEIVTPDTVFAWIERAQQRTVLHLKEEIEAVRMSVRCRGLHCDIWPPTDETLDQAADLERTVLSGEIWTPLHELWAQKGQEEQEGHKGQEEQDDGEAVDDQAAREIVGMSVRPDRAVTDSPGTTYRFVLPLDVALEFELAERVYEAMVPDTPERPRPSFLAFACLVLFADHKDAAEASVTEDKWGQVYLRDRFRCQNPVCGSRKTVTPHHMKFQSHGGGDEPENIKTLCHVCHLAMVHEHRSLVVEPPASRTRWLIGGREAPLLEVVGREVVRRAS